MTRVRLHTFCVAGTRKVGTRTSEPALCSTCAAAWKSSVLPPVQDLHRPELSQWWAELSHPCSKVSMPQKGGRDSSESSSHPMYTRSMGVPEHSAAVLRLSGRVRGCHQGLQLGHVYPVLLEV